MKRVLRSLVAATALAGVAVPTAAIAAPPKEPASIELQQRLDDLVAAYAVGALAEVRADREVWRGTSGVAEIGRTRPVPATGRFRIGSVTKAFVATVVLQLVAEGRLRLEDTVEKWLPGVVPGGDRIPVRQLLNHTSGLFDYKQTLTGPPQPEFLEYRWRTWTASELIERAVARPPVFEPPGREFSYSNTNYLVLGEIIEKVTGRSYGTEIERRLIRPLGLHGTEVPGTSPWIRGPHSHGYVPIQQGNGLRLVDFTVMNPSLFGAAGEMTSTARDLNQFFRALLGGRLLPRRLLAEMKTPAVEGRNYGLGLAWRDTSCGLRIYGSDGDSISYQTWSFQTENGRRQATVALSPNFQGDTDDAVDAFLDSAVCR